MPSLCLPPFSLPPSPKIHERGAVFQGHSGRNMKLKSRRRSPVVPPQIGFADILSLSAPSCQSLRPRLHTPFVSEEETVGQGSANAIGGTFGPLSAVRTSPIPDSAYSCSRFGPTSLGRRMANSPFLTLGRGVRCSPHLSLSRPLTHSLSLSPPSVASIFAAQFIQHGHLSRRRRPNERPADRAGSSPPWLPTLPLVMDEV